MANVNVLSDADLRKKLKDLGVSAGPITKTTRSSWVKKLTKLLGNFFHCMNILCNDLIFAYHLS